MAALVRRGRRGKRLTWGQQLPVHEVFEAHILAGDVRAVIELILAGCKDDVKAGRPERFALLAGPRQAQAVIGPPNALQRIGGNESHIDVELSRKMYPGGF